MSAKHWLPRLLLVSAYVAVVGLANKARRFVERVRRAWYHLRYEYLLWKLNRGIERNQRQIGEALLPPLEKLADELAKIYLEYKDSEK